MMRRLLEGKPPLGVEAGPGAAESAAIAVGASRNGVTHTLA